MMKSMKYGCNTMLIVFSRRTGFWLPQEVRLHDHSTTVDRLHQQLMHRTVASLLPHTTLRRLHQGKPRRVASHLPTSTVEHLHTGTLPPTRIRQHELPRYQ